MVEYLYCVAHFPYIVFSGYLGFWTPPGTTAREEAALESSGNMTAGETPSPKGDAGPLVLDDLLRLLYAGTLLKLPFDDVRDFWTRQTGLPLYSGDEATLYRRLWESRGRTPLESLAKTFRSLECCLLERNLSPVEFVRENFGRINHGSIVPAKTLLVWMRPFLELYFSRNDIRRTILRTLHTTTGRLAEGLGQDTVRHDTDKEWASAVMLLLSTKPVQSFRLYTPQFARPLPPYDPELWTATVIQEMPRCLDLPPFEEVTTLSDPRPVAMVIDGLGSKEPANDVPAVRTMDFEEFCAQAGLDLSTYRIPPTQIEVVDRDYRCPRRDRVVLRTGCAYGAPVVLYRLHYRLLKERPAQFLSSITREIADEGNSVWAEVEQHHQALLDRVTFTAAFVYHRRLESISINGKHFVKYVPAKILRRIVAEHVEQGRTEFEHREFTHDPSIITDSSAPNLVVRLRRISEQLQRHCPQVVITRAGRGIIGFEPSCKVTYEEM